MHRLHISYLLISIFQQDQHKNFIFETTKTTSIIFLRKSCDLSRQSRRQLLIAEVSSKGLAIAWKIWERLAFKTPLCDFVQYDLDHWKGAFSHEKQVKPLNCFLSSVFIGYLKDGKEKVRKFDPLNLPETKAEVDLEKLR